MTVADELINIHPGTPPVRGYRDLTQAEVDKINEIKGVGEQLGELVASLRAIEGVDQEWLKTGELDLKRGMMALVRSVAKPTGF